MNIDFERDNYKFNARVSAIILNKEKNKILLFKIEDGRDYFLLPGGRIELYEDSLSAIKREVVEELGYTIDFNFCSIQENFITKNDKKIIQFCFCYKGIYDGVISNDRFVCKDNNNQYFYWMDIDNLKNYKFYPKSTIKLINSNKLEHIVEKEI